MITFDSYHNIIIIVSITTVFHYEYIKYIGLCNTSNNSTPIMHGMLWLVEAEKALALHIRVGSKHDLLCEVQFQR